MLNMIAPSLIACSFLAFLPVSFCQDDGKDARRRILIEAGRLEATVGADDPHLREVADRASFLSLVRLDYDERLIARLTEHKRGDLLSLALVRLLAPRYGKNDGQVADGLASRIVRALREVGDRRALPYLVYAHECLTEVSGAEGGAPMATTAMLYELDAALRQFSAGEDETVPPTVMDYRLLPRDEIVLLRTTVRIPELRRKRGVVEKAKAVLAEDKALAEGWLPRGTEFRVPTH